MNKGVLLGIGGLVVVGAIGIFVMQGRNDSENTGANGNEQATESETNGMQRSTFAELAESGEDVMCTYEYTDVSGSQSGTVYVSGQNMRGDFTIEAAGSTSYDAHMISDGEWSYMWGGPMGESQGTKIKVEATETTDVSSEQTFDYDDEYDFDCREWNRDSDKFDLPSGVSFTDLSAQMDAGAGAGADLKTLQCQACDQVPDAEGQAQCRQALGC